jgi:uncharacterized protein with HEPN domain
MPPEPSEPSRDADTLRDLIAAAGRALSYVEGMTNEQFAENDLVQDAVIRCLEIVGEAAGRLSERTRGRAADVPWSEVRGMRNRLIHGYDTVEVEVVWSTVRADLPRLMEASNRLLMELEAGGEA